MSSTVRRWPIVVVVVVAFGLVVAGLYVLSLGSLKPPPPWAKAGQARNTIYSIHEELQQKFEETGSIPKSFEELDTYTFVGSSFHHPQDYTWEARSSDGVHVDTGKIVARGEGLPVLIYDIATRKFWLEDAAGRPFENAPPKFRR